MFGHHCLGMYVWETHVVIYGRYVDVSQAKQPMPVLGNESISLGGFFILLFVYFNLFNWHKATAKCKAFFCMQWKGMEYERNALDSGFEHHLPLTSGIHPKLSQQKMQVLSGVLTELSSAATNHQILIHNTRYTKMKRFDLKYFKDF